MAEIKRKIEPQPMLPIVGVFHSSEGDYEGYVGWCYQHPVSDDEVPELVHNALYSFDDPNQPGGIGELYRGDVIERVRVRVEEGVAYWVINTAT